MAREARSQRGSGAQEPVQGGTGRLRQVGMSRTGEGGGGTLADGCGRSPCGSRVVACLPRGWETLRAAVLWRAAASGVS